MRAEQHNTAAVELNQEGFRISGPAFGGGRGRSRSRTDLSDQVTDDDLPLSNKGQKPRWHLPDIIARTGRWAAEYSIHVTS